jgi:hypothetical protein
MRTTVPAVLMVGLLGTSWYLFAVGDPSLGSTVIAVLVLGSVLWSRLLRRRGKEPGPDDRYREALVGAVCFYALTGFLVVLASQMQGAGRFPGVLGAVASGASAIGATYLAWKARSQRVKG